MLGTQRARRASSASCVLCGHVGSPHSSTIHSTTRYCHSIRFRFPRWLGLPAHSHRGLYDDQFPPRFHQGCRSGMPNCHRGTPGMIVQASNTFRRDFWWSARSPAKGSMLARFPSILDAAFPDLLVLVPCRVTRQTKRIQAATCLGIATVRARAKTAEPLARSPSCRPTLQSSRAAQACFIFDVASANMRFSVAVSGMPGAIR